MSDYLELSDAKDWDLFKDGEDFTIDVWIGFNKLSILSKIRLWFLRLFKKSAPDQTFKFKKINNDKWEVNNKETEDPWHHIALIKVPQKYSISYTSGDYHYYREFDEKNKLIRERKTHISLLRA